MGTSREEGKAKRLFPLHSFKWIGIEEMKESCQMLIMKTQNRFKNILLVIRV
jgi:hypothetical protein